MKNMIKAELFSSLYFVMILTDEIVASDKKIFKIQLI